MTTGLGHPAPEHPVLLTGLRPAPRPVSAPPLLVRRTDQDFVAGLLADLASDERRPGLQAAVPPVTRKGNRDRYRLLQPVQRVFYLAVLEAFCDRPGQPALDPASIDSAGLVVRRLDGANELAWVTAGTRHFGWERTDPQADPQADRRALPFSVGHPHIDALLPSNRKVRAAGATRVKGDATVTERVYPLFVAPPDVCAAAGKTLLFGNVPVTSSDQAEPADPAVADPKKYPSSPGYGSDPQERAQLRDHLVHYLKASSSAKTLPLAGSAVSGSWLSSSAATQLDDEQARQFGRLGTFLVLLQQLDVEFDAFASHAEAQALRRVLDRYTVETDVPLGGGKVRTDRAPAGAFLESAKRILHDGESRALTMPDRWSAVSGTLAEQLFEASLACLERRYRTLRPARGRYDDEDAEYVVRAFVRLKPEKPGCPAQLVWSPPSAPFTIAPWYESGDAAPTTVALPDLFDRNVLKSLKPNVAFTLPPKLAKLLQGDPKKLRDGEGSTDGWTIGWICSFSIPIITLCAFIVLNIFLSLLNIIFFWLPFLKICIPIPKSKPPVP
jgi:hypothetical protein